MTGQSSFQGSHQGTLETEFRSPTHAKDDLNVLANVHLKADNLYIDAYPIYLGLKYCQPRPGISPDLKLGTTLFPTLKMGREPAVVAEDSMP